MSGRYCGAADLQPALLTERALWQLTSDDPAATSTDETVLDAHIVKAEALVESHLAARYALPLTSVPAVVVDLAARLVRYSLMTMGGGEPPEWLIADRKEVLETLSKIAKGQLELGLTLAGEDASASPPSGKKVSVKGSKPVFGRANMGGY